MGLPRFDQGGPPPCQDADVYRVASGGAGSTGVSIIKIAIDSHLTLVKKGPTVGLWQSL